MPDDINDNQVAEQANDKDFGGGFEDQPVPEKAPGKKEDNQAGGKEEEQKTVDPDDGATKKEDGNAEDKSLTAQERMEERARASAGEVEPKKEPRKREEERVPAKEPEPKKETVAGAGSDAVKKLLDDPEIAGVKVGDTTLGKFAEEYPEVVQTAVVLGKAIAQKMLDDVIGSGRVATSEKAEELASQINMMRFWDGVYQSHPDARKIAASKEFNDWTAKQSPLVKKLIVSENVEDAVTVLDAYKESLAKDSKKAKDKEAGKRKEARDGLHGESLRGKSGAFAETAKDQEDFDAGFNDEK